MRQQDIGPRRNQLPFLTTRLASLQIEAPIVELGLPRTAPHLEAPHRGARVQQVLAVRDALDHLDALLTDRI